MSAPDALRGGSYTTGMVHTAVRRDGLLIQACGISRRQIAALYPTDEPVTCKRCLARG